MNLDEALALYKQAMGEIRRATEEADRQLKGNPRNYGWSYSGSPDADTVRVATTDGVNFHLLWEEGEYSGHHVEYAQSIDEWRKQGIWWRQKELNPNGGWKRREIVNIDRTFSDKGELAITFHLHCGHLVDHNRFSAVQTAAMRHPGAVVECRECRDAGYGLDVPDPFAVEEVTA